MSSDDHFPRIALALVEHLRATLKASDGGQWCTMDPGDAAKAENMCKHLEAQARKFLGNSQPPIASAADLVARLRQPLPRGQSRQSVCKLPDGSFAIANGGGTVTPEAVIDALWLGLIAPEYDGPGYRIWKPRC